ncbi:MAG: DNA polymerase III subunit delta [Clostridia bacterium]|nr:DNA polymerase III subunit delta [Clostridia bacterium]
MNYQELRQKISKNGVFGVYLLEGEDGYFLRHSEEAIKAACLDMPDLDYTLFDGTDLKGSDAFSALSAAVNNFPFGSRKRVVQVDELYPTDDAYEKYLKPLFASVPDTAVLIIKNSGVKKSKLAAKKNVQFVDCGRDRTDNVPKWISVTLKRAGVSCDYVAAKTIAEYCVYDMSRVEIETEKLTLTGLKEIALSDVETYVYKDAEYRVYELGNAVAGRDYAKYCEVLKDLQLKGSDPGSLLSTLLTFFNELCTILSSDRSDEEIASILGKRNPYAVGMERRQALKVGRENAEYFSKRFYALLADTRNGFITPESALSCATAEIFFKNASRP